MTSAARVAIHSSRITTASGSREKAASMLAMSR